VGTNRGQTGIVVSVLFREGASDGLGAPPNDGDTFLRRGGLLREVRRRVPRFSRSVSIGAYRLSTWLTHPNGTVAAQGSYLLEFL